MEDGRCKEESESLPPGIFEIPGEPAVLINGVPDVPPFQGIAVNANNAPGPELPRHAGFGEWLVGREVRKMFGDLYYSGTVTEYDKEAGWYRVVYEDGDFEDLEWHELRDLLEPLDIAVPLKTMALKIIRKSEKPDFPTPIKAANSSTSAHKSKSEVPSFPTATKAVSSSTSAYKTKSGKPRGRPRKGLS